MINSVVIFFAENRWTWTCSPKFRTPFYGIWGEN